MLTAATVPATDTARYARCIEASQRVRWDIEADVIQGRRFDFDQRFLPEGLARTGWMDFLSAGEQRLVNQVQGRTYARLCGLLEGFIAAGMLEIGRDDAFGEAAVQGARVAFADDGVRHQALFRRIDELAAEGLPPGYRFVPEPDALAGAAPASAWAALALACHVEFSTQAHQRQCLDPDGGVSALYRDVFCFHGLEATQRAVLAELEWRRVDARLGVAQRDDAVEGFIGLVRAVDGVLRTQAGADADYFLRSNLRRLRASDQATLKSELLAAYRWQFILSGAQEPRFVQALSSLITTAQGRRIQEALAPLTQ